MTKVSIVGIYIINPTTDTITAAALFHDYPWLLDDAGVLIDEINWNEFQNLGLVEVEVDGEFSPDDLMSWFLNDQAPYMEFYLDSTGRQQITEEELTKAQLKRVCFYLHFIDFASPLRIGTEYLELPNFSELPERLINYVHYLPPD